MALPVGVTTATITFGVPVTFTGAFVRSTVSIQPSAPLIHTATGTPLLDFVEDVVTTEGTSGQFTLPHTDQTGFQDENGNSYQNWYYTATIVYDTNKGRLPARTKTFQLVSGQTVVDLDLIPSGAPVLPYTAATSTVTSLNGRTGAVTVQDSDLPTRLSEASLATTINIPAEDSALGNATRQDALGTRLTKVGMVLTKGPAGAFDSDLVESLCVRRDPATGQFAGTYVGYGFSPQRGAIGLAYSNDGVHWRKEPAPILSRSNVVGSPDEKSVTGPVWYYDNGTYYLFYIGATADGYEGGVKSICLATATSLKGPWTRQGAVITADAAVPWRAGAVWHPSIIKHKGRWYMFFNTNNSAAKEVIGYAVADSLAGPWTPDDVNSPILSMGASVQWNGGKTGDPSVRRLGDMYVMHYFGVDTLQSFGADGIAMTTYDEFPLGWKHHPYNPVLTPTAGTYDGKFAHKPIVMVERGNVYDYYTAVDASNNRGVALAISSPAPATSAYNAYDSFVRADAGALGTATTGQTWTYSGGTGWALVSNQAKWTGTADGLALLDSGLADNIEISFRILAVNGNYPVNVVTRRLDGSTYVNLYRGNGRWNINRNGTTTAGSALTPAPVVGDTITVLARGRSYAVLVNGIQVESFITAGDNYTSTVQGLGGAANTVLQVDQWAVRPI